MTNQILLSVDKRHLSAAPGSNATLSVTVQNLTTLLDQVAVRADGIDGSWVQVIPPYLPVFAQGEATARIVIQPPRDASRAIAGKYPLRIRGASQEFPGQEAEAESELEVQFVGDYRFGLGIEKRDGKEAIYPLKVQNDGNAELRVQFRGNDTQDTLWFKFDPFQLTIPPGGTSSTLLTLRPKASAPSERTIVFTLTAQGEYSTKDGIALHAPTHQIAGEFVQGAPARLTIGIQPLQVQARDRGVFVVRVGNPGAAPATVQLAAQDEQSHLDFEFQTTQATLAPQSETNITLAVRRKESPADGLRQDMFQVTATPVDGETPAVATEATFVQLGAMPAPQRAPFPWALVVGVLAFACLALFVLVVAIGPTLLR